MPIDSAEISVPSSTVSTSSEQPATRNKRDRALVTPRSFILGLLLSGGLAALNSWIEYLADVHFLGGVQMPFGAIFALLVLIVVVNGVFKVAGKVSALGKILPPLSSAELLTIYMMMTFAALVSTSGTENFFLTTGAVLFYFSTRENGWADLFYSYIPKHFAPGWDGSTYQREVIEPLYTGGLSVSQIPWHAWSAMLIGWGIFLLFIYSALFWTSLLLRRQWIENEALTFPLVQLPLQMVESTRGEAPPAREFWANQTMWAGAAVALCFHMLRGLNNYFPDWPQIAAFQGGAFSLTFTEVPWSSAGGLGVEFFFGAIGIAYLLTREVSFSFWVFFLFFKFQMVAATMAGFPAASLPKDTYLGNPAFLTWQSVGSWMMMGGLLLWSARGHIKLIVSEAINPPKATDGKAGPLANEPFSPRTVLIGFLLSCAGLLGWCAFSGINIMAAFAMLALYAVTSIVLARLVVEGGFLFPQATFAPLETITGSLMGAGAVGAASLTRLSFLQPMLFSDMRTNPLPGFLHTLKIAHDLKFDRRDSRRLMIWVVAAILVSWAVATFVTLATVYKAGGLTGYSWFTQAGPQMVFRGTATMISSQPGVSFQNWGWMATGAGLIWLIVFARARFLWFPLHPIAFLVSAGYPINRLWGSFFIGWLCKTLILKFGGQSSEQAFRPLMIGFILGNAVAMVLWMIYGFFAGTQIPYWPA